MNTRENSLITKRRKALEKEYNEEIAKPKFRRNADKVDYLTKSIANLKTW